MTLDKISIAIPAYEMRGFGGKYLRELLASIEKQSYKKFEVVVADQSEDQEVYNACMDYADKFRIVYVKNFYKKGNGPANTNVAIERTNGELVKIMFQDDIFVDDLALLRIRERFLDTNASWLVNGFAHTSDGKELHREMVPRWSDHLLEGQNFMGGPSIVTMRRECVEFFDEECRMLMDTEFYHRMRYEYGMPTILPDILHADREGDHRVSANLDLDIICQHPEGSWHANSKELDYVVNKHRETRDYAV